MKILRWLSEGHVGSSSKAIALTSLGEMPRHPAFPWDGDDLGRCVKLLELCPDAKAGLDELAVRGGPVWAGLVKQWDEIVDAYRFDENLFRSGVSDLSLYRCYDLMQTIIRAAKG